MKLSYHFNLIYQDFEDAVVRFDWHSKQVKQAGKTALACTLSVFICNLLVVPYAYWAGISTLIMMRPHVSDSLQKGWMRFGGAAVGCLLSLPFAAVTVQNPLLFSCLTVVIITIGFYMGKTNRYGYFWAYMSCHIVLIGIMSVTNPYGAFPEHIAFFRAFAIFIGVCCSLTVNVVVWPDFLLEDIKKADLCLKTTISEYLHQTFSCLSSEENVGDGELYTVQVNACIALIANSLQMIKDSVLEQRLFHDNPVLTRMDLKALKTAMEEYHSWFLSVGSVDRQGVFADKKSKIYKVNRLLVLLINEIDISSEKAEGLKAELRQVFVDIESLIIADSSMLEFKPGKLLLVFDGLYAMRQIFHVFADQKLTCKTHARIDMHTKYGSDVLKFSMFRQNWFIHVPTLKYALKGGIAFLGLFWVWLFFQVPCSAISMSIAVVTVLQMDLMTTSHKGILRIVGCLVGASLGLCWLAFGIEAHLFTFMALFFVVSALAYIWGSKPGVAYIGAQAAIAFLVAVVHDIGPAEGIGPPLQRVTAIVLGVLCVWTVNALIWPEDLLQHYQKQIKDVEHLITEWCLQLKQLVRGDVLSLKLPEGIDWSSLNSNLKTLKDQQELSVNAAVCNSVYLATLETLQRKLSYLTLHWNPKFVGKMKLHAVKFSNDAVMCLDTMVYGKVAAQCALAVELDVKQLDRLWGILFRTTYFQEMTNHEKIELIHFIIVLKRFLKRLAALSSYNELVS